MAVVCFNPLPWRVQGPSCPVKSAGCLFSAASRGQVAPQGINRTHRPYPVGGEILLPSGCGCALCRFCFFRPFCSPMVSAPGRNWVPRRARPRGQTVRGKSIASDSGSYSWRSTLWLELFSLTRLPTPTSSGCLTLTARPIHQLCVLSRPACLSCSLRWMSPLRLRVNRPQRRRSCRLLWRLGRLLAPRLPRSSSHSGLPLTLKLPFTSGAPAPSFRASPAGLFHVN